MVIDKDKIIIRRVGSADIDTMITYRIKYLTEIQGERPAAVINHLQNELSSYFNTGIQNGSVVALVAIFKSNRSLMELWRFAEFRVIQRYDLP